MKVFGYERGHTSTCTQELYGFVGICNRVGYIYPKQPFLADYGAKKGRFMLKAGYGSRRELFIPKE